MDENAVPKVPLSFARLFHGIIEAVAMPPPAPQRPPPAATYSDRRFSVPGDDIRRSDVIAVERVVGELMSRAPSWSVSQITRRYWSSVDSGMAPAGSPRVPRVSKS